MTLDLKHLRLDENLIHKYEYAQLNNFAPEFLQRLPDCFHPKSVHIKDTLELTCFVLMVWTCDSDLVKAESMVTSCFLFQNTL